MLFRSKIFTITVDDCISNDGMIVSLVEKLSSELLLDGSIFYIRCCDHILKSYCDGWVGGDKRCN